jgi:hypothetical protein
VEWPQAWYLDSGLRAGDTVATYIWLSTARERWRSSQCAGPVVVLNAPGYSSSFTPLGVHVKLSTAIGRKGAMRWEEELYRAWPAPEPSRGSGCRSRCPAQRHTTLASTCSGTDMSCEEEEDPLRVPVLNDVMPSPGESVSDSLESIGFFSVTRGCTTSSLVIKERR